MKGAARELEGEQNRLLYESEDGRLYVRKKQPPCRVGQCGGRLIRKMCATAGWSGPKTSEMHQFKVTSAVQVKPLGSFAPSLWGVGLSAWGGCGSGAGAVAAVWIDESKPP